MPSTASRRAQVVSRPGELSLATQLGGTTLALRHARTLARVGYCHVRFIIEDEAERTRVQDLFEHEPAPEGIQLSFDTVAPSADEVVLEGPSIYLRETLNTRLITTPTADFVLTSNADVKAAEAFLFDQIRKSVQLDGVIAYYIMRPLARVFTRSLLNTSVSPNQATLMALACGVGAALCAGLGGATLVAIAGLLYWLGGVLDCIDGELARMRLQSSKIGEWLDSMVDEFSTIALIIGLGIGMSRDGYGDYWQWLGLGGGVVAIMTLTPMYVDLHRQRLPIDTAQFPWFFGNASAGSSGGVVAKTINIIGYFIRRDANITGTALLLVAGYRRLSLGLMLAAFALVSILTITHYTIMMLRSKTE